jgi:hypothetical protein
MYTSDSWCATGVPYHAQFLLVEMGFQELFAWAGFKPGSPRVRYDYGNYARLVTPPLPEKQTVCQVLQELSPSTEGLCSTKCQQSDVKESDSGLKQVIVTQM